MRYMSLSPTALPGTIARRFLLRGHVQGFGVRPAICRLADDYGLAGYVQNTLDGVEVIVKGESECMEEFRQHLIEALPDEALVSECREEEASADAIAREGFHIEREDIHGPLATRVPPDRAVCDKCVREISDPVNRRHRYAFTSCTLCGPRYSIISEMPYERTDTSMATFALCSLCNSEYTSSLSRRFHAQTNACEACGPQVQFVDAQRRPCGIGDEALRPAVQLLQSGKILALKGVGGYQLLADATCDDAVSRLRKRKRRPSKPLAVMVGSLAQTRELAFVDQTEEEVLTSSANPIVLLNSKEGSVITQHINPGLNVIGLMLPTTPLHALLCGEVGRPLVCTSGNVDGDPLLYREEEAEQSLSGTCDGWLHHDRPIIRPIDDSVVRVIAGQPVTIRLARGLAPLPLDLSTPPESVVALGGHVKSALAWSSSRQAVLGAHIGDLETLSTRERFVQQLLAGQQMYRFRAARMVHDLHPDYFTTHWASEQKQPAIRVQHHWAHVLAGMLEHGWLERTVLGVAWDGTGYGPDGTVWGGEFMIADVHRYRRVARLRPFSLFGGEQSIRQVWRLGLATCRDASGVEAALSLFAHRHVEARQLLDLRTSNFSQRTSSAGRLFDAAAAIILGIDHVDYEGQAAMILEAAADEHCDETYTLSLNDTSDRGDCEMELDWRPMFAEILHDRERDIAVGLMAMKFHRAMADGITAVCRQYPDFPIVLGGGVFQNRLLTELVADQLHSPRQQLGLPGLIPPGDGGLAAGQLVAAIAGMEK